MAALGSLRHPISLQSQRINDKGKNFECIVIVYMYTFVVLRVEGKGAATIAEVVFDTECVPKGEGDTSAREKELEKEREELQQQKKDLESELSVLKKEWDILDSFANTASKGGSVSTYLYKFILSD